jgi:Kef-type K+ transport system membrane component KefB
LGTTALACAAVNDVTAWTILAFVVAIAQATNLASTALCLALVVVFVAIMLRVVRPQLSRMLEYYYLNQRKSEPGRAVLAGTLLVMTTSALVTDVIGIHALFGAFLAGVVMPTRHGFPFKLRIPTKLGFKNPKYVVAMEVTNIDKGGYWEDKGYNWFSGL